MSAYNRALLMKFVVAHLVKMFPNFDKTQRFIAVLTRARHWSLSWALESSSYSHTRNFLRIFGVLFFHLRLLYEAVSFF
jgi:hypothetical protein